MSDEKDKMIEFYDALFEGMSKNLGEHLSTSLKNVRDFRNSLNRETDRGCALMACAYLEDRLGEAFKKYLVDDEKIKNEILGNSGPIGSFSAKVKLAYLLGKIPKEVFRDLDTIRKIRNQFAHNPQQIDFNTQQIKDICLNICSIELDGIESYRNRYTRTVCAVLASLEWWIAEMTPISSPEYNAPKNPIKVFNETLDNAGLSRFQVR